MVNPDPFHFDQLELERAEGALKTESRYFQRYLPEREREAASNVYLMSLVGAIIGLPLPIVNLAATLLFFAMSRKRTAFVKYHCYQAIFSQLLIVVVNSICLGWTVRILFDDLTANHVYFAFLATVILFNIFEYITTITGAIEARKGKMFSMMFFGPLSYLICRNSLGRQLNSFPYEK
jgi:hypothetical protein